MQVVSKFCGAKPLSQEHTNFPKDLGVLGQGFGATELGADMHMFKMGRFGKKNKNTQLYAPLHPLFFQDCCVGHRFYHV